MKSVVSIDKLEEFSGRLEELHSIIEDLIHTYGKNAVISFDAGHNNMVCELTVDVDHIACFVHPGFEGQVCLRGTKSCITAAHKGKYGND